MVPDRRNSPQRGETAAHRAIDWLLLHGNRLVVAAGVLVVTLLVLFVFEPFPQLTTQNVQPLFYVFSAMLGGNLNLLTIVVSINQLVLTRELRSPRKFRQDIDGIRELRADVEATEDQQFAPITPAGFARQLVDSMEQQVAQLRQIATEAGDHRLREELTDLADAASRDLEETRPTLDQRHLPTDDVVIALLAVDFATLYHSTCRLRSEYGDVLSDEGRAELDRLATQLELLDVTREHYKQLFTRESLSNMSRIVLYLGIPTEILMTLVLIMFVGVFGATPSALSPGIVYAAAVVGLSPLAVVFAYILRAATIARRTATTTQFTTSAERL